MSVIEGYRSNKWSGCRKNNLRVSIVGVRIDFTHHVTNFYVFSVGIRVGHKVEKKPILFADNAL